MLQSYDDLINDTRNTYVTVQGTRGGKARYYLHIVKRCLQLQAVNLWVSGEEDGSKYSLDATLLPTLLLHPFSTIASFFFRASTCPSYPGQAGRHHPPHRGIPIYLPRSFFHPGSWSTVQNENTQLIASPITSHAIFLCSNYAKGFPSENTFAIEIIQEMKALCDILNY